MKTAVIYFSPTGGTLRVVDLLSKAFLPEVKIDLSESKSEKSNCRFEKEDLCFIGVPSFGGRVPAIAVERMKKIKGNGARVVLVVVYGNRAYDDTLLELKEVALECGFRVITAVAAVAEHSIMHQFAEGRPDAQDEMHLLAFSEKVEKVLAEGDVKREVEVPGNKPYRDYNGVPLKPKTNKDCNQCGLCAKNCPVHAIPKENPSATVEATCISCMRCVSICPNHARKLNKLVLAVASQKIKKACEDRKGYEIYL